VKSFENELLKMGLMGNEENKNENRTN